MRWDRFIRLTNGSSRAATWTTRHSGFSTRPRRLARIEVIGARQLADREVIPQALKLNPELLPDDLCRSAERKEDAEERARGSGRDRQLPGAARGQHCSRPVLDHLREVGEARSATEIEAHFKRNFNIEGMTVACEYLADQGLIGKASTAVQLTRKSNVLVQELAFVHLGEPPDGR